MTPISTTTKAKEYLLELHRLKILISQREDEKRELQATLYRINNPVYEIRGGKPHNVNATYTVIYEKLEKLQTKIDLLLVDYEEAKEQIITQIQSLSDPTCVELLYKRYVENKPLRTIAREMSYDYDYIREKHGKALSLFGSSVDIESESKRGTFRT